MKPLGIGVLEVHGEHRVAVHTRGGRTRRGSVKDIDLSKSQFALVPQGGGAAEPIYHAEVKAVFFMLPPGEKPKPPDGGKVRVTFADGRSIEGYRDGADAKHGFFAVDRREGADPQVGALLGRPATRVARLRTIGKWIGVELKAGAHAKRQRAAIHAESGELHVDLRHEVRRVDNEVVAAVVVVGTEVLVQIEWIRCSAGAQAGRRVRSRLGERVREPCARIRPWSKAGSWAA